MSKTDPLNHLGSIWYQIQNRKLDGAVVERLNLEPSDIPYSPNQFLALDSFAASHSKMALTKEF